MRRYKIEPSNGRDELVVILLDGNTVVAEHTFPCAQADDDDVDVRDDALRECKSIGDMWVATGKDPYDGSFFLS